MAMPAPVGDLWLIRKYVNLHSTDLVLFIAWVAYTLAHPKVSTSKYLILTLGGGQGTGKTSLCTNVILPLIDPSVVGVQMLPSSDRDLAIALHDAHLRCFDNVRGFKHAMADTLCIAATGGAITTRRLYTDADLHVVQLHGALVFNGIHAFVNQADLAQRCLSLQLLPLPEARRLSETEMVAAFQKDLPAIQRGLFDLIAKILQHLPSATVTNPERMIDFCRWLAAMEIAQDAPPGVYQAEFRPDPGTRPTRQPAR